MSFQKFEFLKNHTIISVTVSQYSKTLLIHCKDKIKVSEDDLKKLPLIKWCILETIRLRAPGVIARKVLKPVKILVSFDFVLK